MFGAPAGHFELKTRVVITDKLIGRIYNLFILNSLLSVVGQKKVEISWIFYFRAWARVTGARQSTKLSSAACVSVILEPLIDIVRRMTVILCKWWSSS